MLYHIYFSQTSKQYKYHVHPESRIGQYVGENYYFAVFTRGIDAQRYCESQNGAK